MVALPIIPPAAPDAPTPIARPVEPGGPVSPPRVAIQTGVPPEIGIPVREMARVRTFRPSIRSTPLVRPTETPGESKLTRNLRDLLGQFRSLAIGLHDRLAGGDPTAMLLLGVVVLVVAEVARRELRKGQEGPPSIPEDPDLGTTWGIS